MAIVGPALAALAAYRSLLPARSAQGSALALQAESFRRFLHASEGKHVEWAWTHGLLREYSGWAVALGEADAWNRALAAADVPPPARASMGPIIVAGHRSSITASHTKPSSSSSSGFGRVQRRQRRWRWWRRQPRLLVTQRRVDAGSDANTAGSV